MSETVARTIAQDPHWLPHDIDWNTRTINFLKVPKKVYTEPGFLFEYAPPDPQYCLSATIDSMQTLDVDAAPLHFIFHTAFCRSTLLVKALNISGCTVGLAEPKIVAALASGGTQAIPLIAPVMRLLSRKRFDARAVFVKPTNHANRIIPHLLEAVPQAHAILMTNSLEPFLQSVRRRGLMGHRWGRNLYREIQSYAHLDLGMSDEETFVMSDLQVAGLAWILNQRYFHHLASGRFASRIRILDGDQFNRQRMETVAAVLQFCDVDCSNWDSPTGEVHAAFATHAKLGGTFQQAEMDEPTGQEIAMVREWIEAIAAQIDLEVPLKQTLRISGATTETK